METNTHNQLTILQGRLDKVNLVCFKLILRTGGPGILVHLDGLEDTSSDLESIFDESEDGNWFKCGEPSTGSISVS